MTPDAKRAMRESAPEIIRAQRDEIERLRAREDKLLRATIDATWGEALEDGSVPATKKQDWIIAYARSRIDEQ